MRPLGRRFRSGSLAAGSWRSGRSSAAVRTSRRSISAGGWSRPGSSRRISISTSPASSTAARPRAATSRRRSREAARGQGWFTAEDVIPGAERTLEKAASSRHDAHAHAARGRSRHRPARARKACAAGRRIRWAIDIEICVFPQEGLLNNPGTDELMVAGAEARRQRGRRRALLPTPTRTARSTASSRWRASSTSTSTCISTSAPTDGCSTCSMSASRPSEYRLGRPGRHRPRHQAVDCRPADLVDGGPAPGRCRRGAHRAAVDRSLSDGPQHRTTA